MYIYEWKYIRAWSGSGYFGPRDFLPPIRAPVPFAVSLFLFRRSRIIGVSALPAGYFWSGLNSFSLSTEKDENRFLFFLSFSFPYEEKRRLSFKKFNIEFSLL